ncbi:MAG TPA: HAD family phosphatase [Propionibacteriaceae bacterium]
MDGSQQKEKKLRLTDLDPTAVTTLLCDADGTLFPSEEPAFDASVQVTNQCLQTWGVPRVFTARELRLDNNGKNFRSSLTDLARQHGLAVGQEPFLSELERWVAQENAVVTQHLASVLRQDSEVSEPLARLAGRYELAVVTSSALTRIGPCLDSTGLADFFAIDKRFSASDSLPVPTSKPDPAVYQLAGKVLGVDAQHAIAVEDAVAGAESAVRAGFCTIGMLCFVPPPERKQRVADLEEVGVAALVDSWQELERLLSSAELVATAVAT